MSNSIATNLGRLVDAKDTIISAVAAKGGTISPTAGLEDIPSAIATIPSGFNYVTDSLQFISNELIGPKENKVSKVAAADYSDGYTVETAFIITGLAPDTYGRFFEIRHSTGSNVSGSDVLAIGGNGLQIDMAVNGNWCHPSAEFDISLAYNVMTTMSLAVYKEGYAYLYLNGEKVYELASTGDIPSSRNNGIYWYIGCGSVSSRLITGTVYSARVYNKILSASELLSNRAIDLSRAPT